jgi:type I restriction enzyme R subunit
VSTIDERERQTQKRIVRLFRDALKYEYLGNWAENTNNGCIEPPLLEKFLL